MACIISHEDHVSHMYGFPSFSLIRAYRWDNESHMTQSSYRFSYIFYLGMLPA